MQLRIFCHLGPVWPFYPPPSNNPKNQNLKKWKKKTPRDIIYHFTHVYHKWQSYELWFLRYWAQWTKFFAILDHFLSFYVPNKPKNQNFEKMKKKPGDIIILHKCTIKRTIIWCMVPKIWGMMDSFFYFGLLFALFTPITTWKIKILKNWKKTHWDIIILQ